VSRNGAEHLVDTGRLRVEFAHAYIARLNPKEHWVNVRSVHPELVALFPVIDEDPIRSLAHVQFDRGGLETCIGDFDKFPRRPPIAGLPR
jgi:hypothetical protein